jgi:hypothetical protein
MAKNRTWRLERNQKCDIETNPLIPEVKRARDTGIRARSADQNGFAWLFLPECRNLAPHCAISSTEAGLAS